jgi:integrase
LKLFFNRRCDLCGLGPQAERDLAAITKATVAAFRDAQGAQNAAATANLDLKIVRMLFRAARLDGYLFQDPAEAVKVLKNNAPDRRRPFTVNELRSILAVADSEWQSLIKFGLYTGQRLADLATLSWAQIDLEHDEIRLKTRKTGKRLVLPIAGPLREHLMSLSAGDKPGAPVHPRSAGIVKAQHGRVGTLSNQFADLLVSAGLRAPRTHQSTGKGRDGRREGMDVSFHSLRHTSASLLKSAGIPDAVVMELIGHESAAVSRRYTHVGKESLARAAAVFPEL